MSSFKDFYDILKDLISTAKKAKNEEVVSASLDLQEKFFELREENETLNSKIKEQELRIKELEECKVIEEDIEYFEKGFFILKSDKVKIPYCSMCWKKEHKLIPIAQKTNWYVYHCGNCKTQIIVMTKDNKSIDTLNN